MNDLLFKLGFADKFTIELPTTRDHFVKTLQQNIDADRFDLFDFFKSSKNHYKGEVSYHNFLLKRRNTFSNSSFGGNRAEGYFSQRDENVVVDVKITPSNSSMIFIYFAFLIFFYIGCIIMLIVSLVKSESPIFGLWMFPFMILHAALMAGIPYYMIKRNVSKFKYDLERDLYFMIK